MNRLHQDAANRDPWSVVYAAEGTDGFNARLHGVLRDMTRDTLSAVGDPLVAVVVTGAYGVGEGRCVPFEGGTGRGIWSQGQAPGEDVEILVVANADHKVVRRLLRPVSEKYGAILNVGVRFLRILTERELDKVRLSLDWFELVQSHRMLFGSESVFGGLRFRMGLRDDGCADPTLAPDEACWLHARGAFLAMPFLGKNQDVPDRLFFSLVRHLGDVVLLHDGTWIPSQAERDSLVLHLLGDNVWFKRRSPEALEFHELYREAVSFFSAEPSSGINIDCLSFIHSWLMVEDYLATASGTGSARSSSHGVWRGVLRRMMTRLALDWPENGRPERNFLFRFIGAWYYRDN